jgi:hypothetical protein
MDRISQVRTEALGTGSAGARSSREAVEALGTGSPTARPSVLAVEVLGELAVNVARSSQFAVEVLADAADNPAARYSQAAVEVLGDLPATPPLEFETQVAVASTLQSGEPTLVSFTTSVGVSGLLAQANTDEPVRLGTGVRIASRLASETDGRPAVLDDSRGYRR